MIPRSICRSASAARSRQGTAFTDGASVNVTIDDIVFLSATEATFFYDLNTSGGSLAGQVGGARLIDDAWKLTRATYCQDLAKAAGICLP